MRSLCLWGRLLFLWGDLCNEMGIGWAFSRIYRYISYLHCKIGYKVSAGVTAITTLHKCNVDIERIKVVSGGLAEGEDATEPYLSIYGGIRGSLGLWCEVRS